MEFCDSQRRVGRLKQGNAAFTTGHIAAHEVHGIANVQACPCIGTTKGAGIATMAKGIPIRPVDSNNAAWHETDCPAHVELEHGIPYGAPSFDSLGKCLVAEQLFLVEHSVMGQDIVDPSQSAHCTMPIFCWYFSPSAVLATWPEIAG